MSIASSNLPSGHTPQSARAEIARFAWRGRPPVVLQVLPALETGGVERGTVDIAAALAAAGATSLVASSGGRMVREIERSGARHIVLPLQSKNPLKMKSNAARLADLITAHRVDIVHARSRAPAWSAYAACRKTGARFLTTFHGTYNARSPVKRFYNSVMTRGEVVIAISHFIAGHIVQVYGLDPARVRVVPRGIDLSVFDPARVTPERVIQLARAWNVPDGMPMVMLPGRLTRWKGQKVFIEAVRLLGRRDFCCLLVGSDQGRKTYRAEIEDRIERYDLGPVVQIVDHCRDMAAAYMLSDVVISASTDPEAFGRVVVEAAAMGRPVIATDHGGARETVLEGRTGWLVPPDDPDALARALGAALDIGAAKRAAMAEAAQRHARENYSLERMQRATLAVYDELMAASRLREGGAP